MKKVLIGATLFIIFLLVAWYSITPEQKSVSQEFGIREIDTLWNEYTNKKIGFSLRVPKTSYRFVGFDRPMQRISIPIQVIEDIDSDTVYVTDAWTIDREGRKVKDVTLEDLRSQNPVSWKIMTQNVEDKEDIRAFLKKRYYLGCDIAEMTPSNVEGLFDVETTHSSPEAPENENCFINWRTVNKYSPERKLIASWDLGQDINFMGPSQEAYDDEMVASFRFLKR